MHIFDSKKVIINNKRTSIALGNFDGVHLGHISIIKGAVDYALNNSLDSCVYTFDQHTSYFLGNEKKLLTTKSEKCALIEKLGCNLIYFENFEKVKSLSPEQFCEQILKDKLNAKAVFCGENYRFGEKASGTVETLKTELSKYGIDVYVLKYECYNEKIISSTEIRNALISGNSIQAATMLGREYTLSGTVKSGKKLGKKLGFPTLNINIPPEKLVPAYGVYITKCDILGQSYYGITNIGIRPTVDVGTDINANCETYLFDFDSDAYDKELTVKILKFIRSEKKFSSVCELKKQVQNDIKIAKEYIQNITTE